MRQSKPVFNKERQVGAMANAIKAVITGIGCVTPIGAGVEQLWEGLVRGKAR